MTALGPWQNFYMIAGSAAGALIGVQFVVLALIAGLPSTREISAVSRAYTTPTIVHFSSALLLAGVMSAPWPLLTPVFILWALEGLAGLVYAIAVTRRMHGHSIYSPEFEDWFFHSMLPIAAYSLLIAAGVAGSLALTAALYTVAAVSMLLLLMGIHNAWDTVSYHVFVVRHKIKG